MTLRRARMPEENRMPEHTCPVCGASREFLGDSLGRVYRCTCGELNRVPFHPDPSRNTAKATRGSLFRCICFGVVCALLAVLSCSLVAKNVRIPADLFSKEPDDLALRATVAAVEADVLKRLSNVMRIIAKKRILTLVELEKTRKSQKSNPVVPAIDRKRREELANQENELIRTLDRLADEYDQAVEEYSKKRLIFQGFLQECEKTYPGHFRRLDLELDASL